MEVDGAAGNVGAFFRTIDYLSNTFLPVPDLIQAMIPEILAKADPGVSAALSREYEMRRNLAFSLLQRRAYRPAGGIYLVGRLTGDTTHDSENADSAAPDATRAHPCPPNEDDEAFCLRALKDHGVFVHPGYYCDLPPGHFVLTCVAAADRLKEGIVRLNRALEG